MAIRNIIVSTCSSSTPQPPSVATTKKLLWSQQTHLHGADRHAAIHNPTYFPAQKTRQYVTLHFVLSFKLSYTQFQCMRGLDLPTWRPNDVCLVNIWLKSFWLPINQRTSFRTNISIFYITNIFLCIKYKSIALQCFGTVGWATVRASGL